MTKGTVFDIKELAVHDGPGSRVTVFLKGCPMRCAWCHNPEGLDPKPQLTVNKTRCGHCGQCEKGCDHEECRPFGRCLHICPNNCIRLCGEELFAWELAGKLSRYRDYFGRAGGGVTFSGGEPLMQADFLLETVDLLSGIHCAMETGGYARPEVFETVISKLDFVIMDVKIVDRQLHKKHTGVYNDWILTNLEILKNSKKPFVIRTPIIRGYTDDAENLRAIERLTEGCLWEKIPENTLAKAKMESYSIL